MNLRRGLGDTSNCNLPPRHRVACRRPLVFLPPRFFTLAQLYQRSAQALPRDVAFCFDKVIVHRPGRPPTRAPASTHSYSTSSRHRAAELSLFSQCKLPVRGMCMHTNISHAHTLRRFASTATRRESAPVVEAGGAFPRAAFGANGIPKLPSIRTSGVFQPPPSRSKGAAEGEYLQEDAEEDLGFVEDDTVVEAVVNDQPIRRYDWRKRAASRSQKTVDPSALPKGYKRRVRKPPAEFITEKELALRPAVRGYSEKYALMFTMRLPLLTYGSQIFETATYGRGTGRSSTAGSPGAMGA